MQIPVEDGLVMATLKGSPEVVEHCRPGRQVVGQVAPLAARPVLVEDRVHDLPQIAGPGSPVADRATRYCFQAVIIGSINRHCSSDKSLRYRSRPSPASQHGHAHPVARAAISTTMERPRTEEDRT